jgi:hypothetical protein
MSRNPGDDMAGALRLLARLHEAGSALRHLKVGYLLAIRSAASGQEPRVPKRLVEFCLRQDWLERSGGDLVLSHAGWARLRRSETEGDPFREQHQLRAVTLKEMDGIRRPMLVNEAESPLGWLKSRKSRSGRPLISNAQYEAGERLRADCWFAHVSPRVTANWSALAPSGRSRRGAPFDAASLRDEVIAAKERVMRALDAVYPELSAVLVDICCELKGLEEAERSHDWPQRAGKVILQLALTRLARHYGLMSRSASAAEWHSPLGKRRLPADARCMARPRAISEQWAPSRSPRGRLCGFSRPWRADRSSAAASDAP